MDRREFLGWMGKAAALMGCAPAIVNAEKQQKISGIAESVGNIQKEGLPIPESTMVHSGNWPAYERFKSTQEKFYDIESDTFKIVLVRGK